MEEYPIYCAGEFIRTSETFEITDKYRLEPFARSWRAGQKEFDLAVTQARQALQHYSSLSSQEKAEALLYISAELSKQKKEHAVLLSIESAKPLRYALAEVERAIHTFQVASEETKRLPREYIGLDWVKHGRNREGLVKYFPVGIVAGISPFNFPLNLAVHKIAPAIAAGCPIILKPASLTPLSTLALAKIIDKAGLPKGAVNILPMDRKTGNLLATDERLQMLSFTGSPEVGWQLKNQSGKKKVILELGGNAGVIVSENAGVDKLLDKCIAGGFAYSGQICIHAQRFYVHENRYDEFLEKFVSATRKLQKGDPLEEDTIVSNMIDEDNARRVERWIREACKAGATLHCGGERQGNFVQPAVLSGTSTSMKVNAEEIFGPVVCIEKYNGQISEAVRLINDTRFGLQCGIFTDSIEELHYAFNHLEVGGIIHNDVPTLRFDQMPYGGVKDSGLGREGVQYAIKDMMEARVLVW